MRKTSGKKFKSKVKGFKEWLKAERHQDVKRLMENNKSQANLLKKRNNRGKNPRLLLLIDSSQT
jgi:ribosomal protein L4